METFCYKSSSALQKKIVRRRVISLCFFSNSIINVGQVFDCLAIILNTPNTLVYQKCQFYLCVWGHFFQQNKRTLFRYVLQGDPNQNPLFQMTLSLNWSMSDTMLVKPKWVWEAVVFSEFQLIFYTCKLLMLKMTEYYIKHHGVMDKALDCHA